MRKSKILALMMILLVTALIVIGVGGSLLWYFLGRPIDCEVSKWSGWSNCSDSCGNGTQARNRTIIHLAQHGGTPCPAEAKLKENTTCLLKECPIECNLSDWSNWSYCSQTCGVGTYARSRYIIHSAQHGGKPCPAEKELKENTSCKLMECQVDCNVSDWSSWSNCSHSCGNGTRERSRYIIQESLHGGTPCPTNEELAENTTCKLKECPVDCNISDWTSWSNCSLRCGNGTQERQKYIFREAQYGGSLCPADDELNESIICNKAECPVDCNVSSWSACDRYCGNGAQERHRNVTRYTQYGGTPCPHNDDLMEIKNCQIKDCPINCTVSNLSEECRSGNSSNSFMPSRIMTIATNALVLLILLYVMGQI
ncbi:unnamed protein product [Clavelina lepadiformis]|uniref:Spondin-like TSP1 domain-containing protein n=1 Tax=Clavelina lepadiformis TaxID=159417 RepID=A0ABP0FS42_CLALP